MTLPFHKPNYLLRLLIVAFLFVGHEAAAATKNPTDRPAQLTVPTQQQTINLFGGKFRGGATVAVTDLGGDGDSEYIVGAGSNGGPQIEIYDQDGKRIRSFFVFNKTTQAGVNVAAGDIDNDGKGDIVVAPHLGYKPIIEVYDGNGKLKDSFTAFESAYSGGVRVAVVPAHGQQNGYIAAASGIGREMEIKVFSMDGKQTISSIFPYGKKTGDGVTIAAGYSSTLQQSILAIGAPAGRKPFVQVYGLSSKKMESSFLAYDEKMTAGIWVSFQNDILATAPNLGAAPDIRTFSLFGILQSDHVVFESGYRGGTRVALASFNGQTIPVVTSTSKPNDQVVGAGKGKRIIVDLSEQKLKMVENNKVISIRQISTGKWSTPTPTGEYKTKNKITTAYSKPYGLYMEYWMAFSADGSYGLHALPFWKLKDGGKLYEGASHIGTPVSHGCIRQTVEDAKSLYEWAPVGTPVTIQG